MKSHPKVSIIINNYNYGRFLPKAIDSALNQTYFNIEVIVVDDGSTDNSLEIIKSYEGRIISILKLNGGQASALNAGFAASQGEIICFLDSDDIFEPEKVAEVVNVFSAHQDIGWCFHPLEFFGNNLQRNIQESYSVSSGKYDCRRFIEQGKLKGKLPISGTATSGICFRRSLLELILPMPEAIYITSDDYIKYTALGISQGFIILKRLALQRIHDSNAYTLRNDKQRLRAKIQILTAYWMNANFPTLSKFTNSMLALGISMYWRSGEGIDTECRDLITGYFSSVSSLKIAGIYARSFYYFLKT